VLDEKLDQLPMRNLKSTETLRSVCPESPGEAQGKMIPIDDRHHWEELTARFSDYGYRQNWDYGLAVADYYHAVSRHIQVCDGIEVLGLADVRIKKLPLIGTGIAYVSGGPVTRMNQADDLKRLGICLGALKDEFVRRQGLVLRILPSLGPPDWNELIKPVFASQGFAPASCALGYRTLLLDLAPPLEKIRAGLAQSWRRHLNRVERKPPRLRTGTGTDLLDLFCQMYRGFAVSKGFESHLDADFFRRVQKLLNPDQQWTISLAENDAGILAGHVSSCLGDTCVYLLGARTNTDENDDASYLLHWQAISNARLLGFRWYDLGGIDPQANPGVFRFKNGMGAREAVSAGPFEIGPVGPKHSLVSGVEKIYRWMHKSHS
jgi:Acetyltransferase (GNAT) domain